MSQMNLNTMRISLCFQGKKQTDAEIPDTGHYRTASAIPWARKQVISGFLAQGSGRSFSIMTGVRTLCFSFCKFFHGMKTHFKNFHDKWT